MNYLSYLKTTETCNLNCRHCFTSGTQGRKIFWNTDHVIDFFQRFSEYVGVGNTMHYEFHGGEPFLAPVSDMIRVYDQLRHTFDYTSFGCTSNLTFKLTPDIEDFIQGPLNQRIGTSWDPAIRFANAKQESLWRSNVERLLSLGVTIKLFISVTQDTINIEPIELLRWVRDLGVQELDLERLTNNGNARQHPDIFPRNLDQDQWFLKMHRQIQQHDARSWFANEFMENIYDKFERNVTGAGTFCRDCEQKLFTINADGTIGGCPNAAPEENFGHISMGIQEIMTHPQRIHNIACESHRNALCYDCDVFDKCGSDCHQLSWQDDVCGAPKSLMRELKYGTAQDLHKITPKRFKIVPV